MGSWAIKEKITDKQRLALLILARSANLKTGDINVSTISEYNKRFPYIIYLKNWDILTSTGTVPNFTNIPGMTYDEVIDMLKKIIDKNG